MVKWEPLEYIIQKIEKGLMLWFHFTKKIEVDSFLDGADVRW